MEPAKVAQGVATLYALMGSQDHGDLTDAVANDYFRSTKDIPQWAIDEAIERFRSGKEGKGEYVPKPPQLAAVAWKVVEGKASYLRDRAKRDREAREIAEQIATNNRFKNRDAGKTPESRARVGELLKRTKEKLAEVETEGQEADIEALRDAELKQTHDHFAGQARKHLIAALENGQ